MTKIALLRSRGATFEWGPNESRTKRHAYPDQCFWCYSADDHRRTHVPAALCGNAWGSDWPVVDEPGLPTCRACERLLIGGWP